MTQEITTTQQGQLQEWQTPQQIRAQVNRIQEVMKEVMKPETHYGVIPGTKQPTLYKAGAEKILATFRMAVEPDITDLSTEDEHRYLVKVRLISSSGINLGAGVGEASTSEEKYKWRRAICDEEYEDTEETHRRIKYGKWKGEVQKTKQVRTNPADLANTVLKMAKKRAMIDAVLTTTAASDCFTQDIEDLPDGYDLEGNARSEPEAPEAPRAKPKAQEKHATQGKAKAQPEKTAQKPAQEAAAEDHPATDGQKRIITAKLAAKEIPDAEFAKSFPLGVEGLMMSKVNEALAWIAAHG